MAEPTHQTLTLTWIKPNSNVSAQTNPNDSFLTNQSQSNIKLTSRMGQ